VFGKRGRAWLAATILVASSARSDEDPVVARLGDIELRASDVAHALAAMPEYQRRTFGKTDAESVEGVVTSVILPAMRLAAAARDGRYEERPSVRAKLRDVLRRRLVETLRDEVRKETIADAEVRAFYDAHLRDFEQPTRIRIMRILVADEAQARQLIGDARGDKGLDRWKQFARDHSVDQATKMRGGLLGFVAADGSTEVPQLAVDPALYAAAEKVRDGELVPEPVHEGERFAIVWRRGSTAKVSRSLADVRDRVVDALQRQRLEKKVEELLARGKATDVKDENSALLEVLSPDHASVAAWPRASGAPQAVGPTPRATDRGLR
jgi:peptidyl-prolyl cis-trans isomerase C